MTDDRMTMDARAQAVEAMARRRYEREHPFDLAMCGWPVLPDARRRPYLLLAADDLDALLSPSTVPCSECGGTRWINRGTALNPDWESCPAPGCKDGQVSLPPLAVLMGCPHRWCVGCQAYTVTTWTAEGPMCEAERHGERPYPQGGAAPNCPACLRSREEEGT